MCAGARKGYRKTLGVGLQVFFTYSLLFVVEKDFLTDLELANLTNLAG